MSPSSRFVAATLLSFAWGVEASAQSIVVQGTCPGPLDVAVSGATPSNTVVLFVGDPQPAGSAVAGGRCAGVILDLQNTKTRAKALTDPLGATTVSLVAAASTCGDGVQWLDLGSCGVSPADKIPGCAPDADLDGITACVGDCDDTDATVHPGAVDVCGDGIDGNCSGTDASCAPIGDFRVSDGPSWVTDPPVLSCIEACAEVFGLKPADYHCSVDPLVLDHTAFLSGWSTDQFCKHPLSETASREDPLDPGYNCGSLGCAYSAFVDDNCTNGATNHCWTR